ncbi:MAG: ABC transporter ATP-binding protein [Hyphomicrobiales bacterium]
MSALSVQKLTAGYSNQPVLHDVSFEVDAQNVFALIGPNGHGKTTLLRCLSGLIPNHSGHIEFDGRPIDRLRAHQRVELGLIHVPQGDQLFGEMSIEENLLMGAYLRGDAAAAARSLEEVYEFFPRLGERRHQMANSLSGGERRMAGIGRGLMADGRFMMMDEPSLGLAPLLIEQIYDALKSLRASGRTFLIIEENPVRIAEIADRIALMDGGRIVWSGPPGELQSEDQLIQTYFGAH